MAVAVKARTTNRVLTSGTKKKTSGSKKRPFNLREKVIEVGRNLGFKDGDLDAWYNVTNVDIAKAKGTGLLKRYGASASRMLVEAFPEHQWDLSRFRNKPKHYWESTENRRKLLLEIGEKLGIKPGDFDSWYNVAWRDLRRLGASSLLSEFDDSTSRMLAAVFPEHPWDITKFRFKPRHFWGDKENHRLVLIQVGQNLGIKEGDWESWYFVKTEDFRGKGGDVLLKQHGNSLSELLIAVIPEHNWDLSKFAIKPRLYFRSKETQREFILSLAEKMGFKPSDYESFYRIKTTDFAKHGGWALLDLYMRSPRIAITSLFPEHKWLPWKFDVQATTWFWTDPEMLRKVVKHIEETLQFSQLKDWYRLSASQINDMGLSSYLRNEKYVLKLLGSVYPDHNWDLEGWNLKPNTIYQRSAKKLL